MITRIAVLGSTGSIGEQTLDVVAHNPGRFEIEAITAKNNVNRLAEQVHKWHPKMVGIADKSLVPALREHIPHKVRIIAGEDCNEVIAAHRDVDTVMIAVTGMAGLKPLMSAIQSGKRIALANKEAVVCGGELVQRAVAHYGQRLYPVDSEQSAIFQCIQGIPRGNKMVERLILTASGGAFRTWSLDQLRRATPEQALEHPNWRMGNKITIDSATLFNKGLEVIETRFLFDMPAECIDVVIHPQSVVHSLVETVDRSLLAQLSVPDMRIAIQYALTYPDRIPADVPRLSLVDFAVLTFDALDNERFPAVALAYEALRKGGTATTIYNAANEAAVELFVQRKIGFLDIARLVEAALMKMPITDVNTLTDVFDADEHAREYVRRIANIKAV